MAKCRFREWANCRRVFLGLSVKDVAEMLGENPLYVFEALRETRGKRPDRIRAKLYELLKKVDLSSVLNDPEPVPALGMAVVVEQQEEASSNVESLVKTPLPPRWSP